MNHLTSCLAAASLMAALAAAHADPRTDVIKGKTEGITIFGTKPTNPSEPPRPAAATPAPAASGAASSAAVGQSSRSTPESIATPRPRTDGTPQWGDPPAGQARARPVAGEETAAATATPPQTISPGAPGDPRLAVIRGTTDGITIIGTKKDGSGGAKGPEAAASGASLFDRLRGMLRLDPPSGQSLPEVKSQAGSESTGIALPTAAKPGGK